MLRNQSASMKVGSWFQQSKLDLQEILLITYDTVRREQASWIQSEYSMSAHTVADWGMLCRETMLVFLEGSSVKIGGPNRTVEIDESKFGRRKYHRGYPVNPSAWSDGHCPHAARSHSFVYISTS